MQNQKIMELDDFKGWDEISSDEDLFSEIDNNPNNDSIESVKDSNSNDFENTETSKGSKTETKQDDDKKSDKAEEENLFEKLSDESGERDDPGDESNEKKNNVKVSYATTLNFLKDKGFIDFELEENQELTENVAEEIFEDKFEEALDERLERLFENLPETVKGLVTYAAKGGDINQYMRALSSMVNTGITEDIDLDNEKNQELVVREMLKEEGNDEEEIEAQIEYYRDSGKLETISKKKFEKWKTNRKEYLQNISKQQEQAREKAKEEIRIAKREIENILSESKNIGDITVSYKDKKELPKYINAPAFKLNNGTVITEMQKDLYMDVMRNPQAKIQLSTLLRNRNADGTFNFDFLKKETKNKVTKEIKEDIRRQKSNIPSITRGTGNKTKKSILDYF